MRAALFFILSSLSSLAASTVMVDTNGIIMSPAAVTLFSANSNVVSSSRVFPQYFYYTNAGTFTWTNPAESRLVEVWIFGGGGGGGGGTDPVGVAGGDSGKGGDGANGQVIIIVW